MYEYHTTLRHGTPRAVVSCDNFEMPRVLEPVPAAFVYQLSGDGPGQHPIHVPARAFRSRYRSR